MSVPRDSFGNHSSNEQTSIQRPFIQKKRTTSLENIATAINKEPPHNYDAFESDNEIDESAINDDDDYWEGLTENSGQANTKGFFSKRADSNLKLTSHQSLLTIQLHQSKRTANAVAASLTLPSTRTRRSPNGPSAAPSSDSEDNVPLMMKGKTITDVPQQADSTNYTPPRKVLSPRSTCRNMLTAELAVSLKQHLLWERQQKSQKANAVLKGRHRAENVANLKQYPEKVFMKEENTGDLNASWKKYFYTQDNDYNVRGW